MTGSNGQSRFNEVTNNFLKHPDILALAAKLSKCEKSDKSCSDAVAVEAKTRSDANNAQLLACGTDQSCVQGQITDFVQGARSFGLLNAADKSKDKNAFGAMSDMQTRGGLIAANLSAGNANYTQWSASNCVALTDAACGTKFQVQAQSGELLPRSVLPSNTFGGWLLGTTSFRSTHEYTHTGSVCDGSSSTCTPNSTYNALRQYPGPGTSGDSLVNSGSVSTIKLGPSQLGYVTHLVDPTTMSVVNITVPGQHGLDRGWVVRQVDPQPNGVTSVSSYGAGTGANPFDMNVRLASPVWDSNITFGIRPAANSGSGPVNAVTGPVRSILCARFGDCK